MGVFFQSTVPYSSSVGDGSLCSSTSHSYPVNGTNWIGRGTQRGLNVHATPGQTISYQYWYRDPQNQCGGQFNYSNGWSVTW